VEELMHVLVFRCPKCSRPLAASCISDKRTLETADAHLFNPHCHCGWDGKPGGVHCGETLGRAVKESGGHKCCPRRRRFV
jgi:hypothetical protein